MPTFDAGSIESNLTLDRSPFTRELDEAKRQADEFERRTIKPNVELDTSRAISDLDRLKQKLDSLGNATGSVGLNGTDGVIAQLNEIDRLVSRLDGRHINVSVDIRGASEAEARLLALNVQLDEMDRRLRSGVGGSDPFGSVGSSANRAQSGIKPLFDSILLFGPALAQIGVAGVGAIGGLASAFASAGGAVGIYGGVLKNAISLAGEHNKAVNDTAERLRAAQDRLAGTTKGTAEYNAALKEVQAAEKAHQQALAAMSGEEGRYSGALADLRNAFNGLTRDTEKFTLGPITTAMNGLTVLIPKLNPLIQAVGTVVQSTANQFANWASGPGGEKFVTFLTINGTAIFEKIVAILKNLALTAGQLVQQFNPMAQSILSWVVQMSEKLKDWADGGGFKRFADKVIQMAPQVGEFFRVLFQAVQQLSGTLADMGPISLGVATALARIVAALPVPVLNAIVAGIVAWRLATMANTVAQAADVAITTARAFVMGVTATATDAATAATLAYRLGMVAHAIASGIATAAQWAWNAAITANPIGIIIVAIAAFVAAIVYLATQTRFFQTIWEAVWGAIKAAAEAVWNFLYNDVFLPIGRFFTETLPQAAQAFVNFMRDRFQDWQNITKATYDWIMSNVVEPVVNFFTHTIPDAAQAFVNFCRDRFNDFQNNFKAALDWVLSNVVDPIVNFFTHTIPDAAQAFVNFVKDRFEDWKNLQKAALDWVMSNIVDPIVNFFTHTIPDAAQSFVNFLKDRWNDMQNNAKAAYDWMINNIVNPFVNFFTKTIPDAATKFKDLVIEAFTLAKDGVKKVWDLIQEIVKAPVNFIINTVYMGGIRKIWNNTAGKIGLDELPPVQGLAAGGPITGGRPGVDSVPIMAMPGEHMLTTSDVDKMGGQAGVFRFRHALQAGQVKGYADGGPVVPYGVQPGDTNPTPSGPGTAPVAPNSPLTEPAGLAGQPTPQPTRGIDDVFAGALDFLKDVTLTVIREPVKKALDFVVDRIPDPVVPSDVGESNPLLKGLGEIGHWPKGAAKTIENKILDFMEQKEKENQAAQAGSGYTAWPDWKAGDEQRVNWGGVTINKRTAAMMDHAKSVFGKAISAIQGSYSSGVAASAGTHSGGGAIDVGPAVDELVGAMRASGFAAWHRTVAQGFSGDHIHGIAVGDHELSSQAQDQVTAFFAGRNGLADNGPDDYHAPGGPGGVIPTGAQLDTINQALAAAGVPPPGTKEQWQAGLNTLISRESGWNPNAVNNSDSNAAAGTPSIGLAQVIQPTFDQYKVPGFTNIYNPVANVAAAIRYIVATYGNISNVQQANPNLPPKGYADGGWITEPIWGVGMSTGRQYTFGEHEKEYVTPGSKMGGQGGTMVLRVGEREFVAYMEEISGDTYHRAQYAERQRR